VNVRLILGATLVASPFIGTFAAGVIDVGLWAAIAAMAIAFAIMAVLFVGVNMVMDEWQHTQTQSLLKRAQHRVRNCRRPS
jgi:putative Mn2+ efflux pump MntP